MALPPDAIALDKLPADAVPIGGGIDYSSKSAQDTLNMLSTGLLKTVTGQGFQDRALNATAQDIPQSTAAPFDANLIAARNPVNQFIQQGKQALAGNSGTVLDSLTSPIGLLAGVQNSIKNSGGDLLNKLNPLSNKIKMDTIDQSIFPKAQKVFTDTVNKFDTPVQNYAVNKLGVPQEAVNHIANRTPTVVRNSAGTMANTDPIVMKMDSDINAKLADVNKAYDSAYSKLGANDRFTTPEGFKSIKDILTREGWIDKQGTQTLIPSQQSNTTLSGLLDQYNFLKGMSGVDTTIAQKEALPSINKYMWMRTKDSLTKLYRADPNLKGDVKGILDAFHNDAENAGLTGITTARNMFVKYLDNADLVDQFKQRNLDNIFKQPEASLRDLRQLQSYTGANYENQAKDIVSNKYLSSIDKFASNPNIAQPNPPLYSTIRNATDPKNFRNQTKLISDFTGNTKDSLSLIKDIKNLNNREFIRKAMLVAGGAGIALPLMKSITSSITNPITKSIGDLGMGGND